MDLPNIAARGLDLTMRTEDALDALCVAGARPLGPKMNLRPGQD
jgi:hypothetical protein